MRKQAESQENYHSRCPHINLLIYIDLHFHQGTPLTFVIKSSYVQWFDNDFELKKGKGGKRRKDGHISLKNNINWIYQIEYAYFCLIYVLVELLINILQNFFCFVLFCFVLFCFVVFPKTREVFYSIPIDLSFNDCQLLIDY